MPRTLRERSLGLFLAVAALLVASCEVPPAYPTADLVISPAGEYTLDGNAVAEKDLVQALKAVRDRAPATMLNLRIGRIEHGAPPGLEAAERAAKEAGIASTNLTTYKEVEDARRKKSLMRDIVFFGGIVLFAVLVSIPFALGARSSFDAMLRGFFGVLVTAVVVAVVVGLYLDYQDKSFRTWGMNGLIILIYVVPASVVASLPTSFLCALWIHRRSKALVDGKKNP